MIRVCARRPCRCSILQSLACRISDVGETGKTIFRSANFPVINPDAFLFSPFHRCQIFLLLPARKAIHLEMTNLARDANSYTDQSIQNRCLATTWSINLQLCSKDDPRPILHPPYPVICFSSPAGAYNCASPLTAWREGVPQSSLLSDHQIPVSANTRILTYPALRPFLLGNAM